jgi:hypothetical protein
VIRPFRVSLRQHGITTVSLQTCETPEEALASHIATRDPADGLHEVAITNAGRAALGCLVALHRGEVLAVTPRPMAAA